MTCDYLDKEVYFLCNELGAFIMHSIVNRIESSVSSINIALDKREKFIDDKRKETVHQDNFPKRKLIKQEPHGNKLINILNTNQHLERCINVCIWWWDMFYNGIKQL